MYHGPPVPGHSTRYGNVEVMRVSNEIEGEPEAVAIATPVGRGIGS